MGRRRLRLSVLEEDDDDDGDHEEQRLQALISTRPGATPSPLVPAPDAPLEISDDDEDFADVSDAFSTPSPPPPPPPAPSSVDGVQPHVMGSSAGARPVGAEGEGPSGPVDAFLRTLGLRLRRDWLESCLAFLSSSHVAFQGLDDAGKAKLCFEQFLFSDMNFSGGGVLPQNVSTLHGVTLDGPYVLQVDEIVNISAPLRDRYHDALAGSKRCLKLSMTDGTQRVYGMEYRPISQLKVLAPAGLKVAIQNVHIWRGLLMLVPEVIEVLGGRVEDLEAARERLVHEVNKPPRGKRKQPVLSLSKRASLAAWPSSTTRDVGEANLSIPHDGNFSHTTHRGTCRPARDRFRAEARGRVSPEPAQLDNFATLNISSLGPIEEVAAPNNGGGILGQSVAVHTTRTREQLSVPSTSRDIEEFVVSRTGRSIIEDFSVQQGQHTDAPCTGRGNTEPSTVQDAPLNISSLGPIEEVTAPNNGGSILGQSVAVHTTRTREQVSVPSTSRDIEEFIVSRTGRSIIEDFSIQQGQHTDAPCTGRGNTEPSTVQDALGRVLRQSAMQRSGECYIEEGAVAHIHMDSELPVSSNNGVGEGDTDMPLADIVEHPLILSGEREVPFTYLACLLAKWAAKEDSLSSIRGKIKCFLTGVKGFQFRQRSTYELRVYVDDGSLISEVLVDHHVVEKGIGYSPKEVTAALSSSDKTASSNMREAMKNFQLFLTRFEGTMLVEMNKEQPVPVAVEMNQCFSTSDAWLLLKRLQTFTASLTAQQQCLNIIDVSP